MVGYFNSLRLLGAAEIQLRDDVDDGLGRLARRSGTEARSLDQTIHLTSREPSWKIPQHLKSLKRQFPDLEAIDVVLATNMISVGVDIDRLGLMVVNGQPQATSEYIQATSRVGRQHAGLVVTLLNAAKSRDRSHYESFVAYHSALYQQVEATSVTPFSPRARDRGLHAVLIGLARMLIPEARSNEAAGDIAAFAPGLTAIVDLIVDRVEAVDPDAKAATRVHLDRLIDDWKQRADLPGSLYYQHTKERALLGDASERRHGGPLPTMWSLRDVDAETNLYLE